MSKKNTVYGIGPVRLHKRAKVWHAHFNTEHGFIRQSLKVQNLKVAKQKAREIAEVLESGDYAAIKNLIDGTKREGETKKRTFEMYSAAYLKYSQANKAESSYKRDECSMRVHLIPAFGDRLLSQISVRDIEAYKLRRLDTGQVQKSTINRELACLKDAMKKACAWGYVRHNPAKDVKVFKEDPTVPDPLKQSEVEALLAACKESTSPDLYPTVVCALETGMRRSELFRLRWQDVDFENGWVIVRQAKSNEFRTIPMSKFLYDVLVEHKKKGRKPYVLRVGKQKYNNIRRSLRTASRKVGFEKEVGMHRFRHTFATHLRLLGVELGAIKELLGHKTWAMTERYARCTPEHLKNAMQKLDDDRAQKKKKAE